MKLFKTLVLSVVLGSLTGCQNSRLSGYLGPDNSNILASSGRIFVIQAQASDPLGISKVEFYVNNVLTCTATLAPYNCPWRVPPGAHINYQLQTRAYDPQGNMGVSTVVNVTSR